MNFNAGPIGVFVLTKLIYVATLKLTCIFRFCCGFVTTFLTLILLSLYHDKVFEFRDIFEASMS